MKQSQRLRTSEWLLLSFFGYVVLLIPFFPDRPRLGLAPVIWFVVAAVSLSSLAFAETDRYAHIINMIRDWTPMAFTLAAFREMELFVPQHYDARYQASWTRWDQTVLGHWGLARLIETSGSWLPAYLELCYLLIYGVGTLCVLSLWLLHRREAVNRFYLVLLSGTLLSYALFPFFPSEPPRLAFPAIYAPHTESVFRTLNLFLLRKATIHSAVFPSAHVSSAFSAAWAMFLILSRKSSLPWLLLIYAVSVAVATVYGRYHYVADAVAGFAVSLLAAGLAVFLRMRSPTLSPEAAGFNH